MTVEASRSLGVGQERVMTANRTREEMEGNSIRQNVGRTFFLRGGAPRSWSQVEAFPSFPRSRLGKGHGYLSQEEVGGLRNGRKQKGPE